MGDQVSSKVYKFRFHRASFEESLQELITLDRAWNFFPIFCDYIADMFFVPVPSDLYELLSYDFVETGFDSRDGWNDESYIVMCTKMDFPYSFPIGYSNFSKEEFHG